MVLAVIAVTGLLLGIAMIALLKLFSPSTGLPFQEKIGVIPINGDITSSMEITSQLVAFKKDKGIRAIILRINSPGGSVGPTQEIHREVQKAARAKKVIASMGGVAASGGYYIAAAADKIVANPGTITGSIGVFMQFFRIEDLLDKIGVSMEVLKSGEFKDVGSPHRKMTARDREVINALIEDIKTQFIKEVAKGRNLPMKKVQKIADGRVFTGSRAKELGLVDSLGNFQDAVEFAKVMAGIKGDAVLVYPKKKRKGLLDILINTAFRSFVRLLQGTKPRAEYRWGGFLDQGISETY